MILRPRFAFPKSAVVASALLLAAPAWAQPAGNARAGHEIALTWCTGCHVVDAAQKSASAAGAPPFAAVAAMPSMSVRKLHAFLVKPHAPMPDFQLSGQQIDDVTAYIWGLREP
jgi:mono/diheme cytochrome c family protein